MTSHRLIGMSVCAAALFCAVLVGSADADTWVNPTNVRASSYHSASLFPIYAINGAGLSVDLLDHSNSAANTMWNTVFAPGNWAGWYEVDFGEVYELSYLDLYNFNDKWSDIDATNRGVKDFEILTSNDGVNYTSLSGMLEAAKAVGHYVEGGGTVKNAPCPPQTFDLNTSARFVKLQIHDNWGYRHTVNGVVGLSELRYYGTATGLATDVDYNNFSVTASSTTRGDTELLINGYGLHENGYGSHEWHNGGALGETGWAGAKDSEGKVTLTFDFDDPTDLASIQIWNLNMWFGGGEASKDFRLLVKQEGEDEYVTVVDDVLGQPAGNADFHQDYSELFAINTADVVSAQLIIDSTYYEPASTAALSELRFIQMVPEPASLALVVIGGLVMMRR